MNKILLCFLTLFPTLLFAQLSNQKDITWPDKFTDYKELPDSLKNNDAVILNENLSIKGTRIETRVAIKILNQNGLNNFKNIQLPQNFDLTNLPNFNKQGRFKTRKNPFVECTINYLIARIIKPNKKIVELPIKYTTNKTYWIKGNGERLYEKVYDFTFDNLQIGDILEYIYQEDVTMNSSQDIIYPNGRYPKLNYNLEITFTSPFYAQYPKNLCLIYNTNIDSANFESSDKIQSNERIVVNKYHYNYLKAIMYPQNMQVGSSLPNISINNIYNQDPRYTGYNTTKANFIDRYRWAKSVVNIHHENIYDAYHEKLKKFLKTIEITESDTFNIAFLKTFISTLNDLEFISAERMNYSGEAQYAASSAERILEGKLVEEFMFKDYSELLSEKNIFYNEGIIIDKRLSTVNTHYRNHSGLENRIIAIPIKNDYKYCVPRYHGLKYFLDELPFYYESVVCALTPCYNCVEKKRVEDLFFVRTPASTVNENVRTETSIFTLNLDSLTISATIKEHLGGQFSTILRPFYAKEAIDSTIPENYFKRCIDKPLAFNKQVSHFSSSETFPFTQKYHCAEKIKLTTKTKIDLHNWFSFTYKKEDYDRIPNHYFFTDFMYTDSYNFLFQFNKGVEISNAENLNKKIENDYFDLVSNFTQQEGNNYLLNVVVRVKQAIIPQKDGDKVMEFVKALDEINNFEIEFKK